ncbi:MAG: hypothetical protein QNJ64_01765 [Crocosphaera sp.]|nr:hypothetical protein [Crocosphaera sp.]
MSTNESSLPLIQVVFLNTSEIEHTNSQEIPIVEVIFDGTNYKIIGGLDAFKAPLASCFQKLHEDFHTVLTIAIDLKFL